MMLRNISSFTAAPPSISSRNSSSISLYDACQTSVANIVINTFYTSINVLVLLPLNIVILVLGFVRWRRRRSAVRSHSDFFTFHLIVLEMFCCLGSVSYTLGIYLHSEAPFMLGVFLLTVALLGQTLFHVLTCVERYLAVVFPVAYMSLRETLGLKIRNRSIACIWLLLIVWGAVAFHYLPVFPTIEFFTVFGFCLVTVTFCCASVLHVLIHPGNKKEVDRSKQKAFQMISAISAALLLRFVGLIFSFGMETIKTLDPKELCALIDSGNLMTIPSSLVLPLLFLHRAPEVSCYRKNTESQETVEVT